MKKTILYSGFLSLLSTAIYAQSHSEPAKSKVIKHAPVKHVAAAQKNTHTKAAVRPKVAMVAPQKVTTPTAPTTTSTPAVTIPPVTTPAPAVVMTPPVQTIDCYYKTPITTSHIDAAIISEWSEKATRQSFTLDHSNITPQLAALKSCFTDQGWQSFNDALQKSGNINAMQKQQLNLSSMLDGKSTTTDVRENQWKVSVPLQVVYQNKKEKLTQRLTVDLIVGRKPSGDLGIMQMIASPQQTATSTIKP